MRAITITLDTKTARKIPAAPFFDGEGLSVSVIRNGASGEIVMAIGSAGARFDLDSVALVEAKANASNVIQFTAAALAALEPRRKYPFTIWAGGLVGASGHISKIHSISQTVVAFDVSWNIANGVILSSPPPPPAPVVLGGQITG